MIQFYLVCSSSSLLAPNSFTFSKEIKVCCVSFGQIASPPLKLLLLLLLLLPLVAVSGKMKLIRSVLWAANAFKLRSSDHPQAFRTFSTLPNFGIQEKTESKIYSNQRSILGMNACSTCNVGARCFIHSVSPKEAEMGNNSRPMDFVRGLAEDNTRGVLSGGPLSRYHIEQDADIVHIKVLRNNAFVTVTDSKGNKKFGSTAGKLTGKGGKVARYAAESTAEHVGREARDRGLRSVVMKVNGFTYFKKKKQAILSFREGYTHSRGDKNPVVYIEDTTRKPHNGCRLPKKRRI